MSEPVRAAGGVVIRDGAHGATEVVLIHRARYEDWTFPKGKREAGESDEECALREVMEETGLTCAAEVELRPTTYSDDRGRPKSVRWWRMRALDGVLEAPPAEIDEARWVGLEEARSLLTYERDRQLLGQASAG